MAVSVHVWLRHTYMWMSHWNRAAFSTCAKVPLKDVLTCSTHEWHVVGSGKHFLNGSSLNSNTVILQNKKDNQACLCTISGHCISLRINFTHEVLFTGRQEYCSSFENSCIVSWVVVEELCQTEEISLMMSSGVQSLWDGRQQSQSYVWGTTVGNMWEFTIQGMSRERCYYISTWDE